MRVAVVLLILALILLARRVREKYSQPNSNYYQTKSGDRVCGDLKYTRGPDLEKCKAMCDQDKRCIGISWHPHRHCWQKGSRGDKHCSRPSRPATTLTAISFIIRISMDSTCRAPATASVEIFP